MSLDDDIVRYLERLTGQNAYPASVPQGAKMPAITYLAISEANPYRTQTDAGPQVARYRLSFWAKTLEEANVTRDLVRADMIGGGGPEGSNVEDGGSFDQDPQTMWFRRRLEILFTS